MKSLELFDQITARRKALPKPVSEKELCRFAGVNEKTLQNMKTSMPGADKLVAIYRALERLERGEADPGALDANSALSAAVTPATYDSFEAVKLIGEVQAGHWLEAVEWEQDRRETELIPVDPEYPNVTRFCLRVVGTSMDKEYADGTILVCVRFIELREQPQDGDHVIVHRRRPDGLTEATVKELVVLPSGARELWPRSNDKRFQTPLTLENPGEEDDNEDVRIVALVIASYSRRRRGGRRRSAHPRPRG